MDGLKDAKDGMNVLADHGAKQMRELILAQQRSLELNERYQLRHLTVDIGRSPFPSSAEQPDESLGMPAIIRHC